MIRTLRISALAMSLIIIALFSYGATIGYISNYEIVITHKNRKAQIFAYRGRVTALHTNYNEDEKIVSQWRISSWQLLFGHQWIRIFESREQLFGVASDDKVTQENLLSQHLWFRFSRIERFGDTIYIWDNHPVPTLYEGKIKGKILLLK